VCLGITARIKENDMPNRFYLVSLYYEKNRVTGANKRFDEIGKCIAQSGLWDYKVVVTTGNQPDWCPSDRSISIIPYHSRIRRLISWLHLSWVLLTAERGIVYSDFQPAPLAVDWFHFRYQLIHDLRNWAGYGRGGLGRLTQTFQRRQLRSAKAVVTVSEFSAGDIVEKCEIDRENIIVSYNGVNACYKEDNFCNGLDSTRSGEPIDILYIATFEPRKNHLRLVKALEALDRPCKVLLIGRDLGSLPEVDAYIKNSIKLSHVQIDIIESLAEATLLHIYQNTKLFVSPSLFEGFGMPLIESAACGAIVACSDIKVFREIMGDDAYYFDPENVNDMARAITTALDTNTAKHANMERFRWPSITTELFNEMENRAVGCEKFSPN
jgi:glycosyltransferase involved in cell wall biosynthesis